MDSFNNLTDFSFGIEKPGTQAAGAAFKSPQGLMSQGSTV
jgi:hypothetical protein